MPHTPEALSLWLCCLLRGTDLETEMPNVHVRGLQIKMKNKALQFLLMYRHNNF